MSRCFPYPPPGYTLSRHSEESLIKSIKLQNEREKKAQRKKDKKRERKERRKEKKDKDRRPHKAEKQTDETIWKDSKSEILDEEDKVEAEERSSLTEEHGEPVTLCAPSSSSDGTDNRYKRKRPLSPLTERPQATGKIFRIRLPSKKQNEPEPCSTSGRTDTFPSQIVLDHDIRNQIINPPCKSVETTAKVGQVLQVKTEGKQRLSARHQIWTSNGTAASMEACLQFKDIIENWVPPSLLYPSHDMDWLFQSKNQESFLPEKRQKRAADTQLEPPSRISSVSWPCAQLLPDSSVYALPYTIPF